MFPRIPICWLILTLGLIARLAVCETLLGRPGAQLPDTEYYEAYADRIRNGQTYAVGGEGAQRTPGYPMFLAITGSIAGRRSVVWCQAIASMGTVALATVIARHFERAGRLPAGSAMVTLAATAFDPYAIVLSGLVLSETFFTTLLVGCAAATTLGRPVRWSSAITGAMAGVAILVRPSGLLLAPVSAVLRWGLSADRRRTAVWLVGASVAWLTVLAPWWIRNAQWYGTFVPTTLNVGASLYDGWNPEATGASDMAFAEDPRIRALSELDRDDHWRKSAMSWAWQHPGRVAELAGIKFLRFGRPGRTPRTFVVPWSPWPRRSRRRRFGWEPSWRLGSFGGTRSCSPSVGRR